jgi:putative acyl-CoA dehydrogenase
MTQRPDQSTHEVFNQPPNFSDVNLYDGDEALRDALGRTAPRTDARLFHGFGAIAGSAAMAEAARLANDNPPTLRLFDAQGHRIDRVEFHPAYHELMATSTRAGLHCSVWSHLKDGGAPAEGRHATRAGLFYMAAQMEAGHCCPITMTNAVVPALLHQKDLAAPWLRGVLERAYDPSFRPAPEKRALTFGMGMTEKQGGTDVRQNSTRAEPAGAGGPGEEHFLTGHKWFMSAPMCDAFLVLAQAPGGLSCFLMPRFLPDGSVNPIAIQRLKPKLGNHSNASVEVEFRGTSAWMVGAEGHGIQTIIEMVTLTRLDCAVSSAGLMRQALARALHHCRHRSVFQKKLIDQPLMRRVLADMALDHEAAVALVFRLAEAFDGASGDATEAAYARIMTPVTKYWVCKALPGLVYEAMECLGGNGYVEEAPLARLYREAPINAIWEGSGNVMCLDVVRAAAKDPEALARLIDAIEEAAAGEARLERAVASLKHDLLVARHAEGDLRALVERLAMAAAGALLLEYSPPAVSDAFLASRLEGGFRRTYGVLPGADEAAILKRASPAQ